MSRKTRLEADKHWTTIKSRVEARVTIQKINSLGVLHREEDRGLVGHFYDMKNRFWAVGCGFFFGKNFLFQKNQVFLGLKIPQ